MAKKVGAKIPEDLDELLRKGQALCILASYSGKDEYPHTTPLQCVYPKGDESLLLAMHKDHVGYKNTANYKKVMLCFLGENNVAYSISGRAGVVRAPSRVHPLMNIVRVDVSEIKCDRSTLLRVDSGVKWTYTSPDAEEMVNALMDELKELARTL